MLFGDREILEDMTQGAGESSDRSQFWLNSTLDFQILWKQITMSIYESRALWATNFLRVLNETSITVGYMKAKIFLASL